MAAEIGHGAFNFGSPDKAQRAFGTGQGSAANQPRQHAGRFQDGHAAASVVIGARAARDPDDSCKLFRRGRVGPGNDSAYHCPVAGTDFGFHSGLQDDLFSRAQPRSQ